MNTDIPSLNELKEYRSRTQETVDIQVKGRGNGEIELEIHYNEVKTTRKNLFNTR